MPGGNWNYSMVGNPATRPGFYANFQADALASVVGPGAGTVLVASSSNWGIPFRNANQVTELDSEADVIAEFGLANGVVLDDGSRACLLAARAGASPIKFVMLATVAAAPAARTLVDTTGTPLPAITVTAKKSGTRGNNFFLAVQTNVVDATKRDVLLYEGTTLLRKWTSTIASGTVGFISGLVAAINNDDQNTFVSAAEVVGHNNTLAPLVSTAMTGGNSGTPLTSADYVTALAVLESVDFNELVFGNLTDTSIQTSVVTWLIAARNNGKKSAVTLGGALGDSDSTAKTQALAFNNEGVRYVWPGMVVDGVALSPAQVTAGIGGTIAARDPNQGSTFASLPWASDVNQKIISDKISQCLAAGVLVLTMGKSVPRIEKDINTLTVYGTTKNELYSSIRVMRELDGLYNGLAESTYTNYVGQIDNNEEGRRQLLSAYRQFIDTLIMSNWFGPDYLVRESPTPPSQRDYFFVDIEVQPLDAIKYVFATIRVMG